MSTISLISRARSQVKRDGLKAVIGKVMMLARQRVYVDETHVWYELPLGTDRPRVELSPELDLIRAGTDELPLLEQLPRSKEVPVVSPSGAEQRFEAGADLWMVLEGRQLAFACWIFHKSAPVGAAKSGRLVLSPEVVCLEDSVASPAFRGRRIAPAAWSEIADSLEQGAVKSIITKIAEDNAATRRAIVKCGYREIATMHFRRVGFREHTTVQERNGSTADWLAEQLSH